jgi:hypothetical protein
VKTFLSLSRAGLLFADVDGVSYRFYEMTKNIRGGPVIASQRVHAKARPDDRLREAIQKI